MSSSPTPVNDKRTINAWAMFDWANSSYALVIMTAIFPIYFENVADNPIRLLGWEFSNSTILSYTFSAAYLLIAIVSPALSGIADYGDRKKFFMQVFTWMGAIGCMTLFFFTDADTTWIGLASLMLATIGFAGALVFYNAYLPLIATPDRYDFISAKGFVYGYIGSLILLVVNLVIFMKYEWFGLPDGGMAARIDFVLVGLWWIGFAQIPFRRLPPDRPLETPMYKLVSKGFGEIRRVWNEVRHEVHTRRFLVAFFCFSAASQTVFFLATLFATKELQIETTKLIMTILLLQVVGIGGAYLFAWLSKLWGNKRALILTLVTWMVVCLIAYFTTEEWQFFLVAALLGLVMGGVQALSRATYSKFFPTDLHDTTSHFSFYDVLEKGAIVFGTFSFGLIEQLTGSMRNSVLFLILFFIIGIALLWRVKVIPADAQHLSTTQIQ
jgi:UMF1 family MFS transporter